VCPYRIPEFLQLSRTQRRINIEWIRSFFSYGKLPDDWVRQSRTISPAQVGETTNAVIKRMEEIRESEKKK